MSKPWPPPRAAELDLDALEVLADVAIDAAKEDTAYTPWADASDVAAGEFKPEECEFVAACSPSTVKALIARVRHHRETLLRVYREVAGDEDSGTAVVTMETREPWLFEEGEAPPKTGLTRSGHGIITGLRRGQP